MKYKVMCIESRRIADDSYTAGEEYILETDRLKKYRNYFEVISAIEEKKPTTKKAKKVENKDAGKTEDK
jgi:hypothetical protein